MKKTLFLPAILLSSVLFGCSSKKVLDGAEVQKLYPNARIEPCDVFGGWDLYDSVAKNEFRLDKYGKIAADEKD